MGTPVEVGGTHALPKFNEKATEIRQTFEQLRNSCIYLSHICVANFKKRLHCLIRSYITL